MTPTEIRNLIAKKIEGQGTMVDIGNGLPSILNGILDMIADIPAPVEPNIITVPNNTAFNEPFSSIISELRQAAADGVIMNTIVMTEDKKKQAKIVAYTKGGTMPDEEFFAHVDVANETIVTTAYD